MTDPISPPGFLPGTGWFERIAERSGLIFYILRVRPDIAFEYLGSALQTRLGIPVNPGTPIDTEAVLGRIDPDSADRLAATLAMEPGQELSMDLKWRHLDGHSVHSRAWMQAYQRPDGSVVQEGVVEDITELREVETELRRSEQRSRLLAENAYDVIWTMAMDGAVTYVSPAVERVRGFTPEEAARQTIGEINTPASAALVGDYYQRVFAAVQAGTEPPVFRGEMEYYRKDGSIMTGELQVIPLVDADGQVFELLGVTRDISARKVFEAKLTEMAVTDPVTGLWNRRHTTELLAADLERGQSLTVLMIDIDHFKAINDSHGHRTGDRVLTEVARRLREQVRQIDVVGRWGGEEFVVLLRDCDEAEGLESAEKLRRTMLDRADAALYEAKRSGRNTVAAG